MHLRTIAVIAASFILGTTSVALAKKPKVAILGLEVVDVDGMDAKIAKIATDLSDALRDRAKVGAGPFRLAPNSKKDLLEMKLISGCSNEARACMADIGKFLKADRLLYGKIEQRKNGYQITLKLLNVNNEKLERSTTELIALDDTSPARINEWARRLYNRLTGVPEQGTLVVTANVETGTVYINDEVKGGLVDGKATISGLPVGTLELRVESDGYANYSTEVTLDGEGNTEVETNLASLDAIGGGGTKGPSKPGGTSRVLFWTTAAITVGGGVGATITGLKVRSYEQDKEAAIRAYQSDSPGRDMPLGMNNENNACSDAKSRPAGDPNLQAVVDACDNGNRNALMTNVLWGVTAVSALAAGYFFYSGYIAPSGSSSGETARGPGEKRGTSVVVTPTISPSYVGAGVQIQF